VSIVWTDSGKAIDGENFVNVRADGVDDQVFDDEISVKVRTDEVGGQVG